MMLRLSNSPQSHTVLLLRVSQVLKLDPLLLLQHSTLTRRVFGKHRPNARSNLNVPIVIWKLETCYFESVTLSFRQKIVSEKREKVVGGVGR
jgi:hypothetical protein